MAGEIVREMPRNFGPDEPRTSRWFLLAVGMTVALGIGLAMLAILCLRPDKEIVRVAEIIREPAPPPEVVIKEVIREVIKEVPILAPKPPPPVVKTPPLSKPWEGVWRPKNSELPMFKLNESKGAVTGIYATTDGAVLPFKGGKVMDDAIELVVDDSLFRMHFRLAMTDSSSMNVTAWITDEDWLISLASGNKMVRTPQQALVVRRQLAANAKLTRKPASMGIFNRGTGG